MKRMISKLISGVMLVSALGMNTAMANSEKVEIEFCVGDAVLMINGENVTVEKPYVVGEGVTLVPVRVITEAFGAQVEWDGATRTVKLTYPDVNIELQIDNPVAEVNGKAEKLLAPPELTEGGHTMVPLRFISENFGAEVGYEEQTGRISVTKEKPSGTATMVEGSITSEYIGDSYFDWRMENDADMYMSQRDFDGTRTSFAFDENNYIDLDIYVRNDDFNFDDEFSEWKDSLQGYTLVKADKDNSDNNNMSMHFQAKDKTFYYDIYQYITDKYIYVLYGEFENATPEKRDTALELMSTFTVGYKNEQTYDLSNVENGMRRFEAETMKISFDVPQNFIMLSGEDSESSFYFYENTNDENYSAVILNIYSKDSVGSAKEMAELDYNRNKKSVNEDLAVFSDSVQLCNYKNISAYEYNYEINAEFWSQYSRDAFFEVGEYVYNIHVAVALPHNNHIGLTNSIIDSIVAQEVDFNEVGTIMRNEDVKEGVQTVDALNKCSMEIPNSYSKIQETKTSVLYGNLSYMFSGTVNTETDYQFSDVKTLAKAYETSMKKIDGVSVIRSPQEVKIGKNKFMKFIYKMIEDEDVEYFESYFTVNNGSIYNFEAGYKETSYSEKARNEVQGILESITFK